MKKNGMRSSALTISWRLSRLALDILLCVLALGTAVVLPVIFTVGIGPLTRTEAPAWDLAAFVLVAALSLASFRTYRMIWKYTSFYDLLSLVLVTAIIVISYFTLEFALLHRHLQASPFMIVWAGISIWASCLFFLVCPRLIARILLQRSGPLRRFGQSGSTALTNTLIVGEPTRMEQFIRDCGRNLNYRVLGAFTDNPRLHGDNLHGVKVFGSLDRQSLGRAQRRFARRNIVPDLLVLLDDTADPKRVANLLDLATDMNMRLAHAPSLLDLEGPTAVQPVALSDLLGRPEIAMGREKAIPIVQGKRILVTGAGGSIGSELCRQIASLKPALLVIIEANEFNLYSIDQELSNNFPEVTRKTALVDVRDATLVSRWIAEARPDVVFHAAALKHVPLVEEHPMEAIKTNVFGTINVAEACLENGVAAMVTISTDKAVNPHNIMGATKRLAEAYCQGLDEAGQSLGSTRFITVRFGNVLGSAGSVVPLFKHQIENGGPVTVTHPDIRRFFMTIPEAVTLVLQAGTQGLRSTQERGSIYVLDMGEPVKIIDLARQMIRLSGRRPDLDIKIEFVGLRPGEKLYEEVTHMDETVVTTESTSIFRATPRVTDLRILRQQIQELRNACNAFDSPRALRVLKLTVPEYRVPEHGVDASTINRAWES